MVVVVVVVVVVMVEENRTAYPPHSFHTHIGRGGGGGGEALAPFLARPAEKSSTLKIIMIINGLTALPFPVRKCLLLAFKNQHGKKSCFCSSNIYRNKKLAAPKGEKRSYKKR